MKQRRPKPVSIAYYIEEVVGYRAKYESAQNLKDGYPPVVPELILSILISIRAIRYAFCFLTGFLLAFLLKLLFIGV